MLSYSNTLLPNQKSQREREKEEKKKRGKVNKERRETA
jgi:hypothetical protein